MPKHVASRDEDLVRVYLDEVGRHPLLTREDEVHLAQVAEQGRVARSELRGDPDLSDMERRRLQRAVRKGEEATETFVTANLRLVISIAKRYQAANVPLLDLVQEGNLGLMHAVEKFDWRKGFKFSTYATWWIRQAISRGIANSAKTIRLPVHASDLLAQLGRSRAQLERTLGRRPTTAELAVDLCVEERKIVELLLHSSEPRSLAEPLGADGDIEFGDVLGDQNAISPFDAAVVALLPAEVAKMLSVLDEREREVLRLRFGLDHGMPRTLDDVGTHFNLTRERIRQIESRAIAKLRHPTSDTLAEDLLGY